MKENSEEYCLRCGYKWIDHIQGRCPPQVAQYESVVGWLVPAGIILLVITVLASC